MITKTDRIDKARFENYLAILHNIARKQDELKVITAKIENPQGAKLSDMPKVAQRNNDKIAFLVQEKIEIEQDIKALDEYRKKERKELMDAVRLLEDPKNFNKLSREKEVLISEASILRLRYFCGCSWPEINQTFYGDDEDFEIKKDEYIRKVFRYHGNAFIDFTKLGK